MYNRRDFMYDFQKVFGIEENAECYEMCKENQCNYILINDEYDIEIIMNKVMAK